MDGFTNEQVSRQVIRIHPRRVISWGVEPDKEGTSARTVRAGTGKAEVA